LNERNEYAVRELTNEELDQLRQIIPNLDELIANNEEINLLFEDFTYYKVSDKHG
jgi:hypothetical protein